MDGPPHTAPVRVTSVLRNRSWLALAPVAAVAFGLAYWGFERLTPAPSGFERIERSIQLVKGGGSYSFVTDPWQLVVAQWLVPLVAVLTAAKLFLASLRRDLRVAFAKRSSDHVIVCGVGGTGRRIVELLRARGERVLAVDLDAESVGARAVESLGTPTIPGDAKAAAVLRLAGVRRARMLVACTGDDTANLEIALTAVAESAAGLRPGRLTVVPEMRADWLYERFVSRAGASLGTETAEVRLLNAAERAGRLLCRHPAFEAPALLRPGRTDLAILGFGDMGRAVAAQALRTLALPGRRMRLLALDAGGAAAGAAFAALHPGVAAVADLVAVAAKVKAGDPAGWDGVEAGLAPERLSALVVCLPDDGDALYAAARARESLDAAGARTVPVFVRVAGRRKLAEMIAHAEANPWLGERFVPYGDLAGLLAAGVSDGPEGGDALARACHEAYLATLPPRADAPGEVPPSQRPWEALPELFKRSNRLLADHMEVKLRAAGLRSRWGDGAESPRALPLLEGEVEALAEAEHWRWLVERRLAGWRHAPVRDDAARLHPLLCDWDALPPAARAGLRETVARIPAILARAGREVRRERVAGSGEAAALDAFDPAGPEHLVLALDPAEADARALALRALGVPDVSLRLVPGGSAGIPGGAGLSPEEADALRARIDGWLDPPRRAGPAIEPDFEPEAEAGPRAAEELAVS